MKTEKQIIEQRAGIYRQMQDLLNRSASENRPMTADENEQWNRMDSDFNALTNEMNAIQRMNGLAATMQPADEPVMPTPAPANAKREFFTRLFNGQPVDLSVAMQRAVTSTTQNNGSYVVPEEFMREIEVFLKAFGGMFSASFIHRSVRGGTMRWPTIDDTAATGSWQAEPRSSGITPRAFSFNKVEYSAHLWTDVLALTYEFLQDEDVDFTSRVMAELVGTSFGRALNKALTDGNGSGKPTGVLDGTTGALSGKTTASSTAITKAEIIDLIHSVDPAYRTGPNVAFMMNDLTLSALKKLDFGTTDTVPLWMPSFREGEPDRILGFRYVVNQDFPNLVASAKSMAFGDWSKYVVRMVQDFSLIRLNERYADELAVGFVAYARVDGKLDKKRRPFRIRINSPGGSVFHGDPIVTAIRQCRSEVHTYIDGMAASMAADIWMAGDKRHMASNSKLMIHRTSTYAFGNAQDLREAADALDKFDEAAIKTFVELTGMDEAEAIERFYNYKDNWLTAADALQYGLIDAIDTYDAKMPDESRTYRQLLTEAMRGAEQPQTYTTPELVQTPEPIQQENWRQAYIDKLGRLITLTN